MPKVFAVCGEYSGEGHLSRLIHQTKLLNHNIEFVGMASELCESMGMRIIFDYKNYSFSGISEIIKNLNKILKIKKLISNTILEEKPDIVLLVDYFGLNSEIAKEINKLYSKQNKTKPSIIQYIAPQLWASRPHRIHKIKKYYDAVLGTLEIEIPIYTKHNINYHYIGNPVPESLLTSSYPEDTLRNDLSLKPMNQISGQNNKLESVEHSKEIIIGIFPGSRDSEIKFLLPDFINAAKELKNKFHNIKFLLAKAPTISDTTLKNNGLNSSLKDKLIKVIDSKQITQANNKVMLASDVLWVCSGTATLEAALYTKPHFLTYKSTVLNYYIYKLVKLIDMAGLANIMAGKYLVKEFLQDKCNYKNFVDETISWFNTKTNIDDSISLTNLSIYGQKIQNDLIEFQKKISSKPTSLLAAEFICTQINNRN